MENTTICYSIVTTWLHSLLVFAKESILLGFYYVRHYTPRKHRYIFVTFFCCLNRGGGRKPHQRVQSKTHLSMSSRPASLVNFNISAVCLWLQCQKLRSSLASAEKHCGKKLNYSILKRKQTDPEVPGKGTGCPVDMLVCVNRIVTSNKKGRV